MAGDPIRIRRGPRPTTQRVFGCFNGLQEPNNRRRSHSRVLSGKTKLSGLSVALEAGNGATALIAGEEEIAARVNGEAAGIVAARPLFSRPGEFPIAPNRKPGNGVVQTVSYIDKPPIGRECDLRREVSAGKVFGQSGNGLFGLEDATRGIVIASGQCRALFLQRIEPMAISLKNEMAGSVAGGQLEAGRIVRRHLAGRHVEFVDQNLIET